MSAQQTVIKNLMTSLKNSTDTTLSALDSAISSASGGRFSSAENLISEFVAACRSANASTDSEAKSFLLSSCGIDLTDNTQRQLGTDSSNTGDTGAITGSDAGGSVKKTAKSIVYEPNIGSTTEFQSPNGGTSNIAGVAVTWPKNVTKSSDQRILAGLSNWWIEQSVALVEESYGLSFENSKNNILGITVELEDMGNTLGQVGGKWRTVGGVTGLELTLTINNNTYQDVRLNVDGDASGSSASGGYLDRVVAHEMVHALMDANVEISLLNKLPQFFREGIAELVHGADDTRQYDILKLAKSSSALYDALELDDTGTGTTDAYAAGYMLLRYFAKQSVESSGTSVSGSTLTVKNSYPGDYVWLGNPDVTYSSSIRVVDASAVTKSFILVGRGSSATTLIGGSGTTAMWGGGASSDTLTGGSGATEYWFAEGDGADTVTRFKNTDSVNVWGGTLSSAEVTSAGNVVLRAGSSSLTLNGAAGMTPQITIGGKSKKAWFSSGTSDDSVTYDSNIAVYAGSKSQTNTLLVSGSGESVIGLFGFEDKLYSNIEKVDASSSTGSLVLVGHFDSADTLVGSKGESHIWGASSDSDKLASGGGATTFWFGAGDGSDVITASTAYDTIFLYDTNAAPEMEISGGSLLVRDGSSTLSVENWSETSAASTLMLSDGTRYGIVSSGGSVTLTRL